jgi:hypothetical protein
VIKRLGDLAIGNLGVVVRLNGSDSIDGEEIVAPAMLFQNRPPDAVRGYRFVFKLFEGGKDLTAQVFREEDIFQPVWKNELGTRYGGTAFEAVWPAAVAKPGWCRVVLTGYSLRTGRTLKHVVKFYHTSTPR